MSILLPLLLAGAPAGPLAAPPCPVDIPTPIAGDRAPRATLRRLDREPPARRLYTVVRTEGGCLRTVPVNDRRYGAAPR